MSNKFSTKGKEVQENISKWFTPASVQRVKAFAFDYFKTPNGSEGVKITFVGKPVEGLTYKINDIEVNGQMCEATYWASEKGYKYTETFMIQLAEALNNRAELDNAMENVSSFEGVVEAMNSVFKGKMISLLVTGQTLMLKNKETGEFSEWIKPSVPLTGGVASVDEFGLLEEKLDKMKNSGKAISPAEAPKEDTLITNQADTQVGVATDW